MRPVRHGAVLVRAPQIVVSFAPLVVITDGAVVVRDEVVEWAGRAEVTPPGPYDEVIDVRGAVLPGLVEALVHLTFDAGSDDPVSRLLDADSDQRQQTVLENGRRFLAQGVTTVRDLGAPAGAMGRVMADILAGTVLAPTIVAADQPLTRRGGHAWSYGIQVESVDDVKAAVGTVSGRGARVVKVMLTGGRMTPGTHPEVVEFAPDLLRAVVDAAHAQSMTVAAHCLSTPGIRAALAGGVDTIEHGTFIDPGGAACSEDDARRLADEIAAAGSFVCPTINTGFQGRHPIPFDQRIHWVRLMHQAGVRVIAGNDQGIPGLPPDLYHGVLAAFEAADMSRPAVLHAATAGAAEAIGGGKGAGTLRVGAVADLVGVDGDPMLDLTALHDPRLVMSRGRVVVAT